MQSDVDLSIIIVSWNVRDHLDNCLRSIFEHTTGIGLEVFVVDNDSHDGSADMVESKYPQATLIRNAENRGFGAANNQAVHQATGRYILYLNDDTYIESNIFKQLVDKFDVADPTVGMIGCELRNPDGSNQPSVRAFPTVFDQTMISLKLHILFPFLVRRYMQTSFNYHKEQTVDQVMGAFMMQPRSVVDEVGMFDEDFFTWFEEVDLQHRLRKAGYSVLYTPDVHCTHVKGASFSQWRRPKAQRMFNKSMRTYFKKNHSWLAHAWISAIQPLSIALAYVVQIIR